MEINTPASIALGREIHRTFGSWEKAREAAVQGDDGVYRIPRERLHNALLPDSITVNVPLLDRLIARWEISLLATVPFSLSILSVWPLFLLVCGFQALSGIRSAVPVLVVAACWCVLAGFEVARNVWTARHPYASLNARRGLIAHA